MAEKQDTPPITNELLLTKMSEFKALKDLPVDEFSSKLQLFQGPNVTVYVGQTKETFQLPKQLLCYHSPYFDVAFNGGFKEAAEQSIHLQETSIEAFQVVIQFIYTGQIIFSTSMTGWEDHLTLLLKFLKTADEIALIGDFEAVFAKVKEILMTVKHPLRLHVEKAMELPTGHTARKFVVDACVLPYARHLHENAPVYHRRGVRLPHIPEAVLDPDLVQMLEESDAFAAELFRAYTKSVFRKMRDHSILNPLTGNVVSTAS